MSNIKFGINWTEGNGFINGIRRARIYYSSTWNAVAYDFSGNRIGETICESEEIAQEWCSTQIQVNRQVRADEAYRQLLIAFNGVDFATAKYQVLQILGGMYYLDL